MVVSVTHLQGMLVVEVTMVASPLLLAPSSPENSHRYVVLVEMAQMALSKHI